MYPQFKGLRGVRGARDHRRDTCSYQSPGPPRKSLLLYPFAFTGRMWSHHWTQKAQPEHKFESIIRWPA
jgi:hypothetical protein